MAGRVVELEASAGGKKHRLRTRAVVDATGTAAVTRLLDPALVQGELAKRRRALSRLVRSLNLVNTALAGRDGDLARLIKVASPVLETEGQSSAWLTSSMTAPLAAVTLVWS